MVYKPETYQQQAGTRPKKDDAQKVLGNKLYFDLVEVEPETLVYKSLLGFFDTCYAINQVLAKHGYFLKFFERCNVYRFLIKKEYKEKMRLTEIYRLLYWKNLMDMKISEVIFQEKKG